MDFECEKLYIRCARQYIGEKQLENLKPNVYTKILSELPGQIGLELLKAGHNAAMVSNRLGHSIHQTALNFYEHSLEDQYRRAADTTTLVFNMKAQTGKFAQAGRERTQNP